MYIQYISARDGQNIFHLVYYVDSFKQSFQERSQSALWYQVLI